MCSISRKDFFPHTEVAKESTIQLASARDIDQACLREADHVEIRVNIKTESAW
ncbi:hypothetical protein SynMITS9220_03049 [Synechococcus sp. MIT S9220]|nr:hypothetical protein SynMITS9220_03049 [Synechococcus sp. MIT S9220]